MTVGAAPYLARGGAGLAISRTHALGLHALARGVDHREVVTHREAKSVSAEETFATDLTDVRAVEAELRLLAERIALGGYLHCATDWQPYAEQMLTVLGAEPLLTNTAARNSRNLRNFFLATAVINLLCIPVGTDLLFRYDELSSIIPIVGWIQFGLLCLAALCSLRRVVDRWLPPSDRMRPTRMFRER